MIGILFIEVWPKLKESSKEDSVSRRKLTSPLALKVQEEEMGAIGESSYGYTASGGHTQPQSQTQHPKRKEAGKNILIPLPFSPLTASHELN